MITGVDLISDSLAIMLDGSGGGTPAVLDEKTITENGVYYPRDETPRLDGYNKVTVNVETYEQELLDIIHQYDPDYDPTDPDEPTIPDKLAEIIEEEGWYTYPVGTTPEDIQEDPLHPDEDPIRDDVTLVSLEVGVLITARNAYNPDFPAEGMWFSGVLKFDVAFMQGCGINPTPESGRNNYGNGNFHIKATDSEGNVYDHALAGGTIYDYPEYSIALKSREINPVNGHILYTVHTHFIMDWVSPPQPVDQDSDYEKQSDVSDLVGWGADGHTFSTRNG